MGKIKEGKEWIQCLSLTILDIYCVLLTQSSGVTKQYRIQIFIFVTLKYVFFLQRSLNQLDFVLAFLLAKSVESFNAMSYLKSKSFTMFYPSFHYQTCPYV